MPELGPQTAHNLLNNLLSHWREQYPRRASGGWWALSGFSFQTSIYLLRFFQRLEGQEVEPGHLAEIEQLSDICEPLDSQVVLIQVKRTLTRSTLKSALEETYLITDLCRNVTPDLLPHLRYQIACRKNEAQLTIESLAIPDSVDETCWSLMISMFDNENPILEQPDNLEHLHSHLWNVGIKDTAGFIQHCTGRLLNHFDQFNPPDSRALGRDLASSFYAAQRRTPWTPLGKILTAEDVNTENSFVPSSDIVAGQTPKLDHLRRDCFRTRVKVFESLWKAFERWVSALDPARQAHEGKVPVFWISGRSGEGKSVLLLQLIKEFVQSVWSSPVLYLGSRRELGSLIQSLPEPGLQNRHDVSPLFVVVDDLYDVGDRDKWDQDLRDACLFRTPNIAIITCGPTDQLEQFTSRLRDQAEVTRFEVPKLGLEECHEFLSWYEARTGQQRSLSDLTLENPILVQFMFELSHGLRISDFAKRFKQRLSHLKVFEVAKTILAINALYLDAPMALINEPQTQDAIERLCKEDQLHFTINPSNTWTGDAGIRLAHSHLAWLMFVEWVEPPATLAKSWARQLAKVLEIVERSQRILDPDKDRTKRPSGDAILLYQLTHTSRGIGAENHDELMRELYQLHVSSHSGRPSLGTLNKWLEIQYKSPNIKLTPDPAACAVKDLLDDTRAADLSGSVAGWVWLIAETLDKNEANHYRTAVEYFCNRFASNPYVGYSLARLLVRSKETSISKAFVNRWLTRNPEHPQAVYVLCRLLSQAGPDTVHDLTELAINWMKPNAGHWKAHELIEAIVAANSNDQRVTSEVEGWLNEHASKGQTHHVLASLVKANPGNPEIIVYASDWIRNHIQDFQVYHILSALISANGRNQSVRELSIEWLNKNSDHRLVCAVIAPLIAAHEDDEFIRGLGKQWLADNSDHHLRHQVLSTLIASSRGKDASIFNLALDWLNDNPTHSGRPHILSPLTVSHGDDIRVKNHAVSWVRQTQQSPITSIVLAPLIRQYSKDAQILALGRKWLRKNYRSKIAGYVFASILASDLNDPTVIEWAIIWLEKYRESPLAPAVIGSLSLIDVSELEESLGNWVTEEVEWLTASKDPLRKVMAGLLHVTPQRIDDALNALDVLPDLAHTKRGQVLKQLSKSLVHNPDQATAYLLGSFDEQRKNSLCPLIANGLKWNPETIDNFISRALNQMPPKFVWKILKKTISNGVNSQALDIVIAEWLAANYNDVGYNQILDEIRRVPNQCQRLRRLGNLREEVLADLEAGLQKQEIVTELGSSSQNVMS